MFRTLIASLTRKAAAPILSARVERPTLALVPVSAETVKGYSYGRSEIRARAMAARTADRSWS